MKKILFVFIFMMFLLMAGSLVIAAGTVTLRPNGAYASQWTRDGCSLNYQCVDESYQDGRVVKTRKNSLYDLYKIQNINEDIDDIEYVQVSFTAKQWRYRIFRVYDKVKTIIRTNGETRYGAVKDLTSIPVGYSTRYYTNPVTGNAWTKSEVNNLLAGVKSAEGGIVEKVYVTVRYGSVCSNNIAESGEVCDNTDLNGETCISQGYLGGTLGCSSNCQSYVTTSCYSNECSDTDGGYNLLTLGTVSGYAELMPFEYTDYCLPSAGSIVIEYDCMPNGEWIARIGSCHEINETSICLNGVCV